MGRFSIAAVLLLIAAPLFAFDLQMITPSPRGATPAGNVPITLRLSGNFGWNAPSSVSFGGVPGQIVKIVDQVTLLVVAPPHDPGYVIIRVHDGQFDLTNFVSFGYGVTEAVLLPIAADSIIGARGSRWSAEIRVHNDADHDVPIDPEYCSFIGRPVPCGPITRIPAHATVAITGRASAEDVFTRVFPPVQDVDSLHFSIHVRDVSKDANGPSTEIAAVRLRDMRPGRVVLPAVPTSDRYRSILRVYAGGGFASVSVTDSATGAVLDHREMTGFLVTESDNFWLYGFSDLLAAPQVRAHERVDLVIETRADCWALLTLTDNETQQVTTFTPQ